jgi:hypothetical protein
MSLNKCYGEEDRQCKYNVTWHISLTTVAMEMEHCILFVPLNSGTYPVPHVMWPIFLSDFDEILVFLTDCIGNHYQISLKSVQGEPSSCTRRDMTKLIDALCDYASTVKMKDSYHIQYAFLWSFMNCAN